MDSEDEKMNIKETCKNFIKDKYDTELKGKYKMDDREFITKKVLKQGGTDFTELYEYGLSTNISPAEKVLLYCYHYFDMHFSSSKTVFDKCFRPEDFGQALFVDFGCGPGTSGLAFLEWLGDADFYYIGIDRARPMLDMAHELFHHDHVGMRENSSFRKSSDFRSLSNVDKTYPVVVLNFCFSLAPDTLKEDKPNDGKPGVLTLCDSISLLLKKFKDAKIYLVYQNPRGNFHEHWLALKDRLPSPVNMEFSGEVRYGAKNPIYCEILRVKNS